MSDGMDSELTETQEKKSSTKKISRRKLLGLAAGGMLAGAAGVLGYTFRIEPHWVRVDERRMLFPNLPKSLEGLRIVQLSDLHVGPQVDSRYLISSLKRASALKPDLTLITGDFMTCVGEEQLDEVSRVIEHLEPGSLGAYASFGNHDYGHHWNNYKVADELMKRLENSGLKVLRNDIQQVGDLQLVGLDDFWSGNFDAHRLVPRVDWTKPTITLCHNPDGVDETAMSDCRGWILAGHTHGGQCKPPFLPPPILPVSNKRYTSGEFALDPQRTLYINRGLGHLRRVRFNVRPEITVFTLSEQT